jgi:hypothetical protein
MSIIIQPNPPPPARPIPCGHRIWAVAPLLLLSLSYFNELAG